MTRMAVCAGPGCERRIPAYMQLCEACFRAVPLELRRELNAAYRRWARRRTTSRQRRALELRRKVLEAVAA